MRNHMIRYNKSFSTCIKFFSVNSSALVSAIKGNLVGLKEFKYLLNMLKRVNLCAVYLSFK